MRCTGNNNCGCNSPIEKLVKGPIGPGGPAGDSGQAVLYNSIGTSTVNSVVTEETLDSYSLPASGSGNLTLSEDDDYIEIVNHFEFTNDTTSHRVRLKFGATTYWNPLIVPNSKTNYTAVYKTRIHRTGTATEYVTTEFTMYSNGFLVAVLNLKVTAIAEDLTTTTLIATTYENAAGGGSATHKGMSVTIFKKA